MIIRKWLIVGLLLFLISCAAPVIQPAGPTQPASTATPASREPSETPQITAPTEAPATATIPVATEPVSTHGGTIAFIGQDKNVWLVDDLTGETRQLTQDGTPMRPGNTQQTIEYCCAQWSTDGRLLAYQRQQADPVASGMSYQYALWTYDLDSSTSRAVYESQEGSVQFSWRPGTHMISFGLPLAYDYFSGRGLINPQAVRGIWAVDADAAGAPFELVRPENGRSLVSPRWSPDGRLVGFDEVVYPEGRGKFAYYDMEAQLYTAWDRQVGNYAWSPDGILLAFDLLTYAPTGTERITLHHMADGSEQEFSSDIVRGYAFLPVFALDGGQIAYWADLSGSDMGPYTLQVQPTAGGEARSLGAFDQVENLAWTSNGEYLTFGSGPWDQRQVVIVRVSDGEIRVLANGSEPAPAPSER